MYRNELKTVADNAAGKARVCREKFWKFLLRAVMAGFFIVVATMLSNLSAAVLYPTFPQFGKLLGALLFSLAIILIVFIGGELFTGNNMTMAIGAYRKSVSWFDVIKVWVVSYVGNFIGAWFLSFLFVKSGASKQILYDYYNSFIWSKLDQTPSELIIRGILCNFLVCLAVWIGVRMKSESGKLVVMFCVIMTFVLAGFEHCIANMGTFSIACMLLDDVNMLLIAKNMLFVTIGNIIGGAVLLGLPLVGMSEE